MNGPEPPAPIDGWRLLDERETILADGPMVTVRSQSRLYTDEDLRERVRTICGLEATWRTFSTVHLHLSPRPSGPVVEPILRTVIEPAARSLFVDDLRDLGFRNVDRAGVADLEPLGDRSVTGCYAATVPVSVDGGGRRTAPVVARLAVWIDDGEARLAGGTYPRDRLDCDALAEPDDYRTSLDEAIRAVASDAGDERTDGRD